MAENSSSLTTKLLNIRDYSDLTLECDEQEFRVHRAIVCAQSPVIAAALKGDYIEAKNGVLHVSFDIESMRRFIEFMYTGDYHVSYNPALELLTSVDEGADTAGPDLSISVFMPSERISDRLLCHGRMNSIADYYDVPALAELSTS
ncbi:hypothetical protein F5B21DRAFT_502079 [Xylaria acuta]|nr:hypothetical protein F5B21DRAFT_502079 [Xylaria acuta]